MKITAQSVIDKLIGQALLHTATIHFFLRRGEKIPERLLPGRMIYRLSEEERQVLKFLKSEMINDRQK